MNKSRGCEMEKDFQLFLHTVDEYKRFANHFPMKSTGSLTYDYSEADYIGIQVRLMLLRKFYAQNKREKVYIKNIIDAAQQIFPAYVSQFQALRDEFDHIESQQLEHILSDGTKLNIYNTIEDSIYGLYLHADENRIHRLGNTVEAIRFFCTRKYILEVEDVVFKLYDLLKDCGVTTLIITPPNRSPLIYLGDPKKNQQSITASPYWSNLYGNDANDEDVAMIGKKLTREELQILNFCIRFTEALKEQKLDKRKLRAFVHPAVRGRWGDFSQAKAFFLSIPNPGFSSKVRFNKQKDTAYVRVFPKVDEAFIINTPHVFSEGYEFALGKWFGKWMIYQFGGHLDSIYEKKKTRKRDSPTTTAMRKTDGS